MTQAGGKTHVSGLDITFDDARHAHILENLERIAVLVRDAGAKLSLLPDGRIEVQIGNCRIVPETVQECGILVEVLRDEIYFWESEEPLFVWDVGANIGVSALYFADVLGWDVAAYELFPVTAQAAIDNFARSGLEHKIHVEAAGVGMRNETLTLPYFADTRGSNGLYGNDTAAGTADSTLTEVRVRDAVEVLDEVMARANGRPILAKFDCEGAEYDIIERLESAGRLRSLTAIVMELHAFPGLDPSTLIGRLLRAGFLIRRSKNPKGHLSIVSAVRLGD